MFSDKELSSCSIAKNRDLLIDKTRSTDVKSNLQTGLGRWSLVDLAAMMDEAGQQPPPPDHLEPLDHATNHREPSETSDTTHWNLHSALTPRRKKLWRLKSSAWLLQNPTIAIKEHSDPNQETNRGGRNLPKCRWCPPAAPILNKTSLRRMNSS